MVSLEHVQLLETKVSKMIEYLQHLNAENAALVSEKVTLCDKLEANQKRLDELEELVMSFKKDQGRIEDGIIAALDRLSQFEEALENSLKDKTPQKKTPSKPAAEKPPSTEGAEKGQEFFEIAPETTPKVSSPDASSPDVSSDNKSDSDDSTTSDASDDDDGELDIF